MFERRNDDNLINVTIFLSNLYCSEKKCHSRVDPLLLLQKTRQNQWARSSALPIQPGLPPGLVQLQQPQQCSPPASTPGISLIILGPQHSPREQEEGSSVSKQFIGAPGLGVHGEPQACLEEPLEKMGRWYVDGPIRILSVRQPLISSGPLVFAAPTIVCLFFSQNIMWY